MTSHEVTQIPAETSFEIPDIASVILAVAVLATVVAIIGIAATAVLAPKKSRRRDARLVLKLIADLIRAPFGR